ncbi:hypothetical protein CIRMBP1312_00442 [Enterococcus cecorum]|nr:hypothetical protein CIRMBP1312_00442 [Enterococcus cecorum]
MLCTYNYAPMYLQLRRCKGSYNYGCAFSQDVAMPNLSQLTGNYLKS